MYPPFLPSCRTDQILQSLHHHHGAERRSHSGSRHPRLGLDRSLSHTLRSFAVTAKNGNLRVGHVAAAAACQAGDGTAQRARGAGADERARGRSGSIKKTEIIKIMILLSLRTAAAANRHAMQAGPGPPKVELF